LVFVTERAFGIGGLSHLSVVAFRQHDLHSLMAITTTTATCLLFVEFAVQSKRKQHGSDTPDSVGVK
jgi:ABC-type dipeptide/oligopeptide/nickel transport system permease component